MIRRTICLAMCLLITLAALCGAAAEHVYDRPHSIKVGFYNKGDYHVLDASGKRYGYGYDLLSRIATYANWVYEYVGYELRLDQMLDMLEKGQIDLLTAVPKSGELADKFSYGKEPIAYSSTIMTIRAGNNAYDAQHPSSWNGARAGLLRNSERNAGFDTYASEHGLTFERVYFDSCDELLSALRQGDSIDIAVTDSMRLIDGEWTLAKFDTEALYAVVKKDNTALLDELDSALSRLYADEPQALTKLENEFFAGDNGSQIAFTTEEREFIEDMRDIEFTAAVNPDRAPYSWYENGEAKGIISDIANIVIERSGLNVRIIETRDRAEYTELVNGGTDMILDAWCDSSDAEDMGCKLTRPYLAASAAKLYLKNRSTPQRTVAMVRRSSLASKIKQRLERDYDLTYYDSIGDAVNAVYTGKEDVAYLHFHAAEDAIYNDYANRLAADKLYGEKTEFSIAVRSTHNVLLMSVLDKCIASLSESEINNIIESYTAYPEKPFSLMSYIFTNPIAAMLIVVAMLFVVFLIFLSIMLGSRRRAEHKKMLEEKDRNELLANALAAAESADRAKSRFLSMVSHELRTPLNAIIGFMELARDADESPERIREYVDGADQSAKQLLGIIDEVLDMSAIQSGRLKLSHEAFDFKSLLSSLSSTYSAQCGRKGVQFDMRMLTKVDDWLIGDKLRLNRILMNLLGNAVKFTDKGRVQLTVRQTDAADGRIFIRFEVSDTGRGMSEEMLTRLWVPFEQESPLSANSYGGSGLGLPIARNLVMMMDGLIDVHSAYGVGSTFTVDLPFTSYKGGVGGARVLGADELRALVISASQDDREHMSDVLERMEVRHACAAGGEEALAELERERGAGDPYSICIVGCESPDADLSVIQSIRARFDKDIVIIVVSASEQCATGEHTRAADADAFVVKPLFSSTLFDLLMSLTGGKLVKAQKRATALDFSGRRLLLVEDNQLNRIVTVRLLKKNGIECETAEDGKQAVTMFGKSDKGYYDAILMDIRMPVMDGLEATRVIRASDHPDAKTVPIIALTAHAFAEDAAKSLQSGMFAHMTKPVDMDLLLEMLGRLFKKD